MTEKAISPLRWRLIDVIKPLPKTTIPPPDSF